MNRSIRHVPAAITLAVVIGLVCVCPGVSAEESDAYRRNHVADIAREANHGKADAQFILGRMYQQGIGVAKDGAKAVEWYRKAADQGQAAAMSSLGLAYADGLGVPRSEDEALGWYRKGIESELRAFATRKLTFPFARSEEDAVKAAAGGNSQVQVFVGKMYLTGNGVAQNDTEAVRWLTEGAKGFAANQARPALALLYEEGRGGLTRDKAQALHLYRNAPEATNAMLDHALSAMALSLTVGALSVAVHRDQDVTAMDTVQGQDIWRSYKRDGIYELQRNLLFGKIFEPGRDENELFPPWSEPGAAKGRRLYAMWVPGTTEHIDLVPESIAAYNADPGGWGGIDGVIPKGTRLRMTRVIFAQTISVHHYYYIAVFIDGPFAGKLVLLNPISVGGFDAQSYDVEYLRPEFTNRANSFG
jgi:TPR repeat protein